MRLNVNLNATKKKPSLLSDVIGLLVLAGELTLFLRLYSAKDWFLRIIPSQRSWIVVCVVAYLVLAILAFRIWPHFGEAKYWLCWVVPFGILGAVFFHFGTFQKGGGGVAFLYGVFFLCLMMIGVAGVARVLWSNLAERNGRTACGRVRP